MASPRGEVFFVMSIPTMVLVRLSFMSGGNSSGVISTSRKKVGKGRCSFLIWFFWVGAWVRHRSRFITVSISKTWAVLMSFIALATLT